MRNLTAIAFVTVLCASSVHAKPGDCVVLPAILDVYSHPLTATKGEWRSRRSGFEAMITGACVDGPADAASRAVVFEFLEKEMTLDYRSVFEAWRAEDGKPLSEGAAEGFAMLQRDLLDYVDRIVAPSDVRHRDIILTYARGRAIAKLGAAVKNDVLRNAATPPSRFHGLVQQNTQAEAMRAIGYWLDPASTVLTPAERREHAKILVTALPGDASLLVHDSHRTFAAAALEALGRSDSAEAEHAIRTWREMYVMHYGAGDELEETARRSAKAIQTRRGNHAPSER
jgi:hypothetical protein